MKFRKLLFYAGLASVITIAGCKKNSGSVDNPGTIGTTGTTGTVATPYTITEDFEAGTKGSYAAANVTLNTGSWNFNDALLGNLATDVKDGLKSVRLKTGDIHMNFDINGLKQISIKHAKYGADANSTWQLLMSTDGGATYTQVGTDISETSTTLVTDSFKVSVTGKVRFEIKKTSATIRINIDDITFKGSGDAGITVGIPDTPGSDTTSTTSATTPRGVTVGSDAPPTSGDNSNLLFGNPSGAQASLTTSTNYLIDQGYYVESYNSTKGEPNWVSWHLDVSNTTNATARLDNFAAFSGLATGFYAVQSNSYSGSGFDRGHNCPSADRTSSVNANSATFLMTNMIPQAPQNNQQTWNNLEGYLRQQVSSGYEVYIIMGSYGTGGVGSISSATVNTINSGHVNVPSNVWKVAVILPVGNGDISRVTSSTRVIAVNTPNINSIGTDWKNYIVTVRDIETATGYNLLSNLPQAVQDAIEVKKDAGQ
ncbi:MAG: non-specific endonuclease [Mucilaginibacter sp.]|uniref:DNA/RNA non-specific endonuclease n=1 Tax=Mucilaginibacter sp. TaxID=1882438 RepID=UPI0026188757|nr:DNA/RNA non-specific endonuclease [Mucilaginibacter sp.]MDB5003662.1 non-specific endonuclease [Mucilaginibacter sp.]